MAERVAKLNDRIQADGSVYIRRPYSFFHGALGGKPTRSETMVAGVIYSFADKPGTECRYTYDRFCRELGISRSTVARCIRAAKDSHVIRQKKRHAGAAYTIDQMPTDTHSFVRTESWMIDTVFELRGGETRRLKQSEIDVLSHIWTHCTNPNGDGSCRGSVRLWAGMLNLDAKTVDAAIRVLLHADLIVRPEANRGVNGSVRSAYRLNARFVRKLMRGRKRAQTPRERASAAETASDGRAERERFYAARRAQAESRAEDYLRRVMQDADYAAAERRSRALTIEIAKAELYSPADVARLRQEARDITARKHARLRALGVRPEDLTPHYSCPRCRDTGFLPDGRACDCYGPPGREA